MPPKQDWRIGPWQTGSAWPAFTGARSCWRAGAIATLDDGMRFLLVPWRPVIEQRLGQQLAATVRGGAGDRTAAWPVRGLISAVKSIFSAAKQLDGSTFYDAIYIWLNFMGIVNIDDDLHDQIRKASAVTCRSINAQAAFWIKIGMLCETNPTLSFNEVVTRELRAAGVVARPVKMGAA